MNELYVGTAGWSYPDWENIVYPSLREKGFNELSYLSRYLDMVEINSTFYRPASPFMSYNWIKKVKDNPNFLFSAKLHQAFTHGKEGFTEYDVSSFKNGLEPLLRAGKLAALLFQFPWSYKRNFTAEEHLKKLFEIFSDFPVAIEVRHSSWMNDSFFNLLEEFRVIFCNIDQPVFSSSIKPTDIVTNNQIGYFRLHGRNYRSWFKEDAGRDERYDYLYSKDELEELIKKIKSISEKTKKTIVVTNNHYRGQAFTNALQIKSFILNKLIPVPPSLKEKFPQLEEISE